MIKNKKGDRGGKGMETSSDGDIQRAEEKKIHIYASIQMYISTLKCKSIRKQNELEIEGRFK